MKTLSKALACGLFVAGFVINTHAAGLQGAGNLLVNFDPSSTSNYEGGVITTGYISNIVNTGTLGGVFDATGQTQFTFSTATFNTNDFPYYSNNTPNGGPPVVIQTSSGAYGVMFDERNWFQLKTTNALIGGVLVGTNQVLTGTTIAGTNPVASIEVWAESPSITDEGTLVSWGLRANGGQNMAFNYGAGGIGIVSGAGAVDHEAGATDAKGTGEGMTMNWGGVPPRMGVWHHLVYTCDGTTTKVYCDGQLMNSAQMATFVISPFYTINIAAQHTSTGFTNNPSGTASGGTHSLATIGKVRIWDGVLTQAEIQNNYALEAPTYVDAPAALTAVPIHNYVFTNAAVTDATGQVVADIGSLGNAPGTVMGVFGNGRQWMTGSALHLDGGSPANGPYLMFPGYFQNYSMLTNLSSAYGGPGQVTVEGWAVPRGNFNGSWMALFSFGVSSGSGTGRTNGIYTNVGSAGGGNNYFEMTQLVSDLDESRQEIDNTSNFNGGSNINSQYDFGIEWLHAPDRMQHYAVTWNEATGEVVTYINGHEQMRHITVNKMNQITDANALLGRDEYGDALLQADYTGFRMYNYVLSPAQVLNDYEAGPKQVVTSIPAPSALHLSTMFTNTWTGEYTWLYVTEDFTGGASGVDVTGNSGIQVTSDNSGVAEVGNGQIKYVGTGTAHIVATNVGTGLSATLTVNVTPPTLTLAHEYTMTGNFVFAITDTVTSVSQPGVWTGVTDPLGAAVVETNQLVLNGTANTDMQFPANLVTGDEAVTVEAWTTFGNTTVNNFYYGFGDTDPSGTGRWYMFASTHSSIRIASTDDDPGYADEAQTVFEGQVADGLTNAHWVAVYDPPQGYEQIYLNGQPYERYTNVVMPFSQSEVDNFNYLGKSLFTADPYFSGSISEFRVYNGVMTSNQAALDFAAGPYNTNILSGVTGGLTSSFLLGSNNVPQSVIWQTAFVGNFANITNVNLFFYSPCTTGSDNTNVCTITPGGLITAIGAGSTQIHATNAASGAVASATVTVINLIPTLQHRWSFNGDYSDSVGGPLFTAIPSNTASIANNQLVLDGVAGLVILPGTNEPTSPAGILSNYVAYSFEAWVSVASNNGTGTWLYMFGDQNPINGLARYYTGLEANGGNDVVASITQGDPGVNGAQNATYTISSLNGLTNTYVAVVEHPYGGFEDLYINGRLSAVNTNITTFFSSVQDNLSYLGATTASTSPFLAGTIDEFRIWSGVLPKTQIVVDNAAGPNTIPASTNLGTFTNAVLLVSSNMALNSVQIATLPGVFQFFSNIDLFVAEVPPPALVAGNTNVLTISAIPGIAGSATNIITAIGPGTTTVTTHFGTNTYTATIVVALPAPPQLMHEYSFFDPATNTTVTDSVGNLTGTLPNGATLSGAGLISFVGTNSQYLNLPGGVLSNYSQVSIDMWVASESAAAGSPPYTYLWMIGNIDGADGANYIFFNPNLGRITISATDPGFNAEQGGTFGTLDAFNTTGVHITGVYNVPGSIQVYTNGVLLVSYTGITDPLSVVGTQNAFFGQSTYSADTYENFALNELRIYSGALDAPTVAAIQAAGPHNAVAVPKYSLSIAHLTNNVYTITYPWASAAAGESLLSSTNLGLPGHFTPVAGLVPLNIGGGNYQVQVTASNTATYYSLGK